LGRDSLCHKGIWHNVFAGIPRHVVNQQVARNVDLLAVKTTNGLAAGSESCQNRKAKVVYPKENGGLAPAAGD
jgi:hypothetical protein